MELKMFLKKLHKPILAYQTLTKRLSTIEMVQKSPNILQVAGDNIIIQKILIPMTFLICFSEEDNSEGLNFNKEGSIDNRTEMQELVTKEEESI